MIDEMSESIGPHASYADHQAGEYITYHAGAEIRTGEIVYILAPRQVGSQHLPLTYVVDSGQGFPDLVWQTDVIETDLDGQE